MHIIIIKASNKQKKDINLQYILMCVYILKKRQKKKVLQPNTLFKMLLLPYNKHLVKRTKTKLKGFINLQIIQK